jgi:tRNA A-37 threonylcarbamoyl transferase component Bud32
MKKTPTGLKLTKLLGKGAFGEVYEHPTNPNLVVKRATNISESEMAMHRIMACLNVAPQLYDVGKNTIIMDRVRPLTRDERISVTDQRALVVLVAKSVAAGLLHNDLHQGNVGWLRDAMVMFDFGYTMQIEPIRDPVVYLQVVMAQLYSLIEPCSKENVSWCHAEDNENTIVADTIYGIRTNDLQTVSWLMAIRQDAQRDIDRCIGK